MATLVVYILYIFQNIYDSFKSCESKIQNWWQIRVRSAESSGAAVPWRTITIDLPSQMWSKHCMIAEHFCWTLRAIEVANSFDTRNNVHRNLLADGKENAKRLIWYSLLRSDDPTERIDMEINTNTPFSNEKWAIRIESAFRFNTLCICIIIHRHQVEIFVEGHEQFTFIVSIFHISHYCQQNLHQERNQKKRGKIWSKCSSPPRHSTLSHTETHTMPFMYTTPQWHMDSQCSHVIGWTFNKDESCIQFSSHMPGHASYRANRFYSFDWMNSNSTTKCGSHTIADGVACSCVCVCGPNFGVYVFVNIFIFDIEQTS